MMGDSITRITWTEFPYAVDVMVQGVLTRLEPPERMLVCACCSETAVRIKAPAGRVLVAWCQTCNTCYKEKT